MQPPLPSKLRQACRQQDHDPCLSDFDKDFVNNFHPSVLLFHLSNNAQGNQLNNFLSLTQLNSFLLLTMVRGFAMLGLATLVAAQTTTVDIMLSGAEAKAVHASVVAVEDALTTFAMDCDDQNSCGMVPQTIIQGDGTFSAQLFLSPADGSLYVSAAAAAAAAAALAAPQG